MQVRSTRAVAPAVRLAVIGLVYYGSARLGLQLSLVGEAVTPLWPPTGVAIVAMSLYGLGAWPAVAVAALAVNAPINASVAEAAVIAVGNTLAPIVAVVLLQRLDFQRDLARMRDAVVLVVVALVAMSVSATIGSSTLAVNDHLGASGFGETWSVWWTGDAMGVLLVGPFLWSIWPPRLPRLRNVGGRRRVEAVVTFGALTLVAVLVARSEQPFLFVILPALGWIAWRFEQKGAAAAGLLASLVVVSAVADDRGPFVGGSLLGDMVVLQLFNASTAFMSFFFAAAVAERRRAMEALGDRDKRVTEVLQRSLLPGLPNVAGVSMAARYLPATADVRIGGDWYDAIPLPGGLVGLAVGDVAGHGLAAASAMAQLRMALRAGALEMAGPAEALQRANRVLMELAPEVMATVVYAEFDRRSGDIRVATAGHLPPLVVPRSGPARYLACDPAPPLGVVAELAACEAVHHLEHGATLVLFTDGLVERRHQPLEDGLEHLRRAASAPGPGLDAICDHIIDSLLRAEAIDDDIAMLAFRPLSVASVGSLPVDTTQGA